MTTETKPERFNGPLSQLFVALRVELMDRGRGVWVRRQLSRGVVISLMRRETDGRRVLLLSRAKKPHDEGAARAWEREVTTLVSWFGADRWEPTPSLRPDAFTGIRPGVWAAFTEPEHARRRAEP